MSYVKHNFTTGQVLQAAQLNQMDDQIAANEAAAAAAQSTADSAVPSVNGKTGAVTITPEDVYILIVNFEYEDMDVDGSEILTADKTLDDIAEAVNNNGIIIGQYNGERYNLRQYFPNPPYTKFAEFASVNRFSREDMRFYELYITWDADSGIHCYQTSFLSTDTTENKINIAKEQAISAIPHDPSKGLGKRLNDVYVDEDALCADIAAGDFSKINIGDYWELSLTGTYRDYGNYTLPAGGTYYSDNTCTTAAGTLAENQAVNSVNDEEDYCEIKVSGTTYYCKVDDCIDYEVKTLNNAIVKELVSAFDPYWRYGESGTLASAVHHVAFTPVDCLPISMKMRPSNNRWIGMGKESFEVTSATGTYTLTDTAKKIRCVRNGGHLLTYNTHYSVSGAAVTLKAAAGVAVGDTLNVFYTDNDVLWTHTAVYKILNDEDYGIAAIIKTSYPKLWNHIIDAHKYNETASLAGAFGSAWSNTGKLWIPTETEVWGANIYGHSLNISYIPQFPIFACGRYRSKGIGNDTTRAFWWVCAFNALFYICYVRAYGHPTYNPPTTSFGVALSFLLM